MEKFSEYKEDVIALYGLGTETEKVLELMDGEYHIAGLLDSFRKEGMLYGKTIISLERCPKLQVKLIIVVARPGSCRAITKRIASFCMENQIALMDVRGNDLLRSDEIKFKFNNRCGITKEELLRMAENYEVISVDLFDTLVMRRTLFPTDIFELVDQKLKEKGIVLEGFCEKRLQGEKELSKDRPPALEEIYRFVLDRCVWKKDQTSGLEDGMIPAADRSASSEGRVDRKTVAARELAELEWALDYELIVPRIDMREIICKLNKLGKCIYITTDTYYNKEQLIKILEKCKITGYVDILPSNEYGTDKSHGLFKELEKRIQTKSCLHIGDDPVVDIEEAERHGFSACRIFSATDLLEALGYLGLWEHTDGPADRIKIGMFAARMFNSPFWFGAEDRELSVEDAYDIGYLFMAPLITDFVIWFSGTVKEHNLENIWFGARDGYLLKQLYDILEINTEHKDVKERQSIYFLTSRTAAIRAGMENEEDILYVASMKYGGSLSGQLQERFGITVSDEEAEGKKLLDFRPLIMTHALREKKNYQTYINRLPIRRGDIAFFDFVAKGTTQMYISKLVAQHLKGIYFLQMEKESMADKGLDIIAFYTDEEKESSAIYADYYIMEPVLSCTEPSVVGFDEKGEPVFADETRTEQDIRCIMEVQEGIADYFKTYVRLCPEPVNGVNKRLDEILLGFMHKIKLTDQHFLNLKVEDPFFNRMTNITDLI